MCSKSSFFITVILNQVVFISIFTAWNITFTANKRSDLRKACKPLQKVSHFLLLMKWARSQVRPQAINYFSILPSAKETMREHDEELEITTML